jgi:hypothetical protein
MYIFALSVQVHRDETTVNILNFVTMQAYEGTMLKVNLPVEFKERICLPWVEEKYNFIHFVFYNISMVWQSINVLLRYRNTYI